MDSTPQGFRDPTGLGETGAALGVCGRRLVMALPNGRQSTPRMSDTKGGGTTTYRGGVGAEGWPMATAFFDFQTKRKQWRAEFGVRRLRRIE